MTDKKDDIEIKVSMAGVDTPVDAGKEATDAPNVASVKSSDTSLGAQDKDSVKGAQAESSVEPKPTEAEKNEGAVPSRDTEDTVKEEGGESKKGTNIKEKKTKTGGKTKGKKSKGSKKEKEKKERQKISIKDIPALLFPEHLGDIFMIFVIFALAIGAGAFWFLAWLPTSEPATTGPQENIRRFSEDELKEIIEILDSREEASKAPVNPPTRDPFSD